MQFFKYTNPLKLEVRALKTFRGMEGSGYNATIYADGKRAIDVMDDATGGELRLEPLSDLGRKVLDDLKAHCATLPPCKDYGTPLPISTDIYLDDLINATLDERKLNRLRAKATPFVLKGEDPSKGYRTINVADPVKAKAFLDKKFPNGYELI